MAASNHPESLSTNLRELDSLLDDLDAVELTDDVDSHLGVGLCVSSLTFVNNSFCSPSFLF